MTFDRSKFKGTKISSLKSQAKREENLAKKGNRPMHELQNGENVVRWYPPHPGDTLFVVPISVWFVPHYKEEGEGQKQLGKKRIFNAAIHSSHGRDIVNEYIQLVTREGQAIYQEESDLKEYLKHIHGYGQGRNYTGGLSGPTKMVGYCEMYVDGKKTGVKRLEVPMLVKNKMNELAITGTDDDDDDPFSSPDYGMLTVITKDTKQRKPQDKYKVAFKMPLQKAQVPLTDSELNAFMNVERLSKLYINSYQLSDFEYALEGLRIFDEQHGYGIFDMEEWAAIVEDVRALCSDSSSQQSSTTSNTLQSSQTTPAYEEDDEDEDDVELDDDLVGLSVAELKKVYKQENPGVKTYRQQTKDDVATLIMQARKSNNEQSNQPDLSLDLSSDDLPF